MSYAKSLISQFHGILDCKLNKVNLIIPVSILDIICNYTLGEYIEFYSHFRPAVSYDVTTGISNVHLIVQKNQTKEHNWENISWVEINIGAWHPGSITFFFNDNSAVLIDCIKPPGVTDSEIMIHSKTGSFLIKPF